MRGRFKKRGGKKRKQGRPPKRKQKKSYEKRIFMSKMQSIKRAVEKTFGDRFFRGGRGKSADLTRGRKISCSFPY